MSEFDENQTMCTSIFMNSNAMNTSDHCINVCLGNAMERRKEYQH
jgi:hypothetical protein